MPENAVTERIIKYMIAVYREPGPVLLENAYEEAVEIECSFNGRIAPRQQRIPVLDRGRIIGEYKPAMLVKDLVVVELKSVERFDPVVEAQVLLYLRITGEHIGLLIHFDLRLVKDGIKTFIL